MIFYLTVAICTLLLTIFLWNVRGRYRTRGEALIFGVFFGILIFGLSASTGFGIYAEEKAERVWDRQQVSLSSVQFEGDTIVITTESGETLAFDRRGSFGVPKMSVWHDAEAGKPYVVRFGNCRSSLQSTTVVPGWLQTDPCKSYNDPTAYSELHLPR